MNLNINIIYNIDLDQSNINVTMRRDGILTSNQKKQLYRKK